ncbi:acyl carrier protein [Streptomyces sp. NPDC058877]|uniref:acyl carrier protein n=1 Tax=unclassified Streptomyces TaxID=2593676 RepID=UPI003679F292
MPPALSTHTGAPLPLDGIRADLLDCVQANLAVLADHVHGPGTHLRLGARLNLPERPLPDGLPTADASLDTRLATDAALVGLRPIRRARLAPAELLAEAARHPGVHYVVADSFHLPWLPYHGNAHMEHSFLLTAGPDTWHVTDAYRIETQWGAAVPGEHVLSTQDLSGFADAEFISFAPVDLAPAPPAVLPYQPQRYVTSYGQWPDRRRALEQLATETWLLARSRKLHAAYRAQWASRAEESEAERAHLAAWDRLVEHAYLAHRRVARGRAEPAGTVDRLGELLVADQEVFAGTPAPHAPHEPGAALPGGSSTRGRIAAVVAEVLGVAEQLLTDGAVLNSLPSFTSFRLVEIIERIESELGRELDGDELDPDRLRTVDDLCRLAGERLPAD